ncbi:MAG TPA: hypothetical protein VMV04_06000 [Thermodesulfobacteriota bacterium]|nr:hypothetical protein [Thermodesulfobacteriota bacterium]
MKISKEHIDKFRQIKALCFEGTKFPKVDNWKAMTSNEIWLDFVAQIIVIGGSAAAQRFYDRADLQKLISYRGLLSLENTMEIKKAINHALREVGSRYACKDIRRCKKTHALAHDLKILEGFKGGPKGFLKGVAEFTGANATKRKIRYFMKIFKGGSIQSKSTRDFLMEHGLIKDAVAIDIRIQNVLKKVGIRVPEGVQSKPNIYDHVETEILNKICEPLKLSGVELDRMLFQNYAKILEMKFK